MPRSVSLEDFSRLTTQIYAASLDWQRWPDFLQSMNRLSGGARCALFGYDTRTETPFNIAHTDFAPEFVASYLDHYGEICPWPAAMASLPVGEVRSAGAILPDETLVKTEFYNDWVRPQDDIACGGGVTLARDSDRIVVFTGNIRRKDSEVNEAAFLALTRLLVRHLRQALDISRAVAGRSFAETVAADDRRDAAVVMLGGNGIILFANRRAEGLIAKGDLLGRDLRGRAVHHPATQNIIGGALAELNAGRVVTPRAFTLKTLHGDWQMQIAALDPRGQDRSPFGFFFGFERRCLLLTLLPSQRGSVADTTLLRDLALTPAETGIALALAEGLTLTEISEARRVSIHTVRNQVKSALAKTGSRRQSDLVRLVERLRHGGNLH